MQSKKFIAGLINESLKEAPPKLTSEQRLLCAILCRALADVFSNIKTTATDKATAIEWLTSNDQKPFSVRWVLDHIFGDGEAAHKRIIDFVAGKAQIPAGVLTYASISPRREAGKNNYCDENILYDKLQNERCVFPAVSTIGASPRILQ